jgi:hypothetical protein
MNTKISASIAFAALCLSLQHSPASSVIFTMNYASIPNSTIQFNGTASSFQFNAANTGDEWAIGNTSGGTGSAIGLLGAFSSGPFSYGPITSTTIAGFGTVEAANVLGPLGGLSINDGAGYFLTGTVNWVQVETINSIGGLNANLNVNVTGLNYLGSNPDLLTLLAGGSGAMNLTFQFSPGKTLTDLTTGSGPYQTTYSGSISTTVVPEPNQTALLGLGLTALVIARLRKKNRVFACPTK